MSNKLISCILVVAFLNLLGCASIQSFTVSEYKRFEKKDDKPDEINVITKDGQEYLFTEPITTFKRDTLHVNGILLTYSEQRVDRKFALSNIESVQSTNTIISGTTFLLVLAICGGIYLILYAIFASTMKWEGSSP
jgi:hypothetical protein